jgi:hypothetical protein
VRVSRFGEIVHELVLKIGVLLGELLLNCVHLCQRFMLLLILYMTRMHTREHTRTHTHLYMYMLTQTHTHMCVCVFVCVKKHSRTQMNIQDVLVIYNTYTSTRTQVNILYICMNM